MGGQKWDINYSTIAICWLERRNHSANSDTVAVWEVLFFSRSTALRQTSGSYETTEKHVCSYGREDSHLEKVCTFKAIRLCVSRSKDSAGQ